MKWMCAAAVAAMAVGAAGAQTKTPVLEVNGGSAGLMTISRERAMGLGSENVKEFYAGESEMLWMAMSVKMRETLKDESTLRRFAERIEKQFGAETAVLHEDAMPAPPQYVLYTRIARFSKSAAPVDVTFTFSGAGTIEGFFVRPEPSPVASKYLEYKDKTKLTWPLAGEWTVDEGGRLVGENYHADSPAERFAYDLVALNGGMLFGGDGAKNEEWFGFGQPVLADAEGTVVKAIDQYDDNVPMHASATSPKYGNSVVIDHGDGEFSVYAHLRRGSVMVKAGEKVKASQRIGSVGNSGDVSFAQLYFNLQTTPELSGGQGLPANFTRVKVNGKKVNEAEPVRGDTVERR